MAIARTVVTLGHATRAAGNLKVRQPLARVVAAVSPEQRAGLMRMSALVADELNVKAVEFAANEADLITYKLLPNSKLLGPKYGQLFPKLRAALAACDAYAAVQTLRAGRNLPLTADGQTVELTPDEVLINPQPREGFAVMVEGEVVVALDTVVTPELRAEGLAREFVRRVQDLRKTAGFDIADRIRTHYTASAGLAAAVAAHADYIKGETLSLELTAGPAPEGAAVAEDKFDGEELKVGVVRK
jgi:isoleucyl-tRNA synthetase